MLKRGSEVSLCSGNAGPQTVRPEESALWPQSRQTWQQPVQNAPTCLDSGTGELCCAGLYPLCLWGAGQHTAPLHVGKQPGCDTKSLHTAQGFYYYRILSLESRGEWKIAFLHDKDQGFLLRSLSVHYPIPKQTPDPLQAPMMRLRREALTFPTGIPGRSLARSTERQGLQERPGHRRLSSRHRHSPGTASTTPSCLSWAGVAIIFVRCDRRGILL